jgi:tetratricopeptide (TPR) repeat protein
MMQALACLADAYKADGKFAEAEPLYKKAAEMAEGGLGPNNLVLADVLEKYADLLKQMKRDDEAAKLEAQAREIRAGMGKPAPPAGPPPRPAGPAPARTAPAASSAPAPEVTPPVLPPLVPDSLPAQPSKPESPA